MRFMFVLIFVLIIIGLIAGGIFLYFYKEKPIQENKIEYENINVVITDLLIKKQISKDYVISLNFITNVYKKDVSLKGGFIVTKIPKNNTVYIFSNITDNSYYNEVQTVNTLYYGPFRINLALTRKGNLTFNYMGNFVNDTNFTLIYNSDGEIRNLKFCMNWGRHIITINNNNSLVSIDKPEKYKNTDKCYLLNNSIKQSINEIDFNYIYFNKIDNSDFINFYFFDQDDISKTSREFNYTINKNINNI